jgi:hypothetical protein
MGAPSLGRSLQVQRLGHSSPRLSSEPGRRSAGRLDVPGTPFIALVPDSSSSTK